MRTLSFFFFALFFILSFLGSAVKAQDLKELFTTAKDYYDQGHYGEAIDYFEKAIALNPNFAPAFNYLGLAYRDVGMDLTEVIWYFKVAIDIDPNYAEAYENLGKGYYGLGDFDKAAANCEKALSLNPKLASAQLALAWIYLLGKNKPERAIYYFQKVTERVNIPNAYYGLGLSYFMNGQNPMVLEIITTLRSQDQEKLATQLEDIVRGHSYIPSDASSLVNIPQRPESQPGVIVGNEITAAAKSSSGKATPDSGAPMTRVRLRGQVMGTAESQQNAYSSGIDSTRARTPQEESAAIQRVRALQGRQGSISSGTATGTVSISPNPPSH